ncbi:MAG: bifunctional 2-C-methyl-D-erythritol 4-phosphate cytidylyltransferase/2-C-methyl-D-erythritol 2,4-cyclodiphosphate synthase [Hyphomicrobium sp.]
MVMTTTAAVIVAAGRGERAGSAGDIPKQYRPLAGMPVLAHSLRALSCSPQIGAIEVVIQPNDRRLYDAAVAPFGDRIEAPVAGGASRQESVRLGLEALSSSKPDCVLIHDAARPFLNPEIVAGLLTALESTPGAIAAQPLSDTLKRSAAEGTITETIDRANLWRAQTPQAFHFAAIFDAHRRAREAGMRGFTDDAALAEWAGLSVQLVPSSGTNMKITTAADLALAERVLAPSPSLLETRTGTGFDVHALAAGDHVWLCGVKVAHTHRLAGHSDADVGLHSLTDAILGAIADGDIGEHFPPTDPAWQGASSRLFVEDAAARVRRLGGHISNVDVTLICEAPKVGPHRSAMRQAIASFLQIDVGRVGVKATTTEGLGLVGRREGIAAIASATVLLPR